MKRLLTIFVLLSQLFCNGQTTVYLEASGTHYGANGTFSDWTNNSSSIKVPALQAGFKQKTSIASTTIAINNSSSTATTCFAQFISPALVPQTISGTVTGYARMSVASTSGCTAQSRVKITVIDQTGAVVATLLPMTSGSSNLTTTLTSYQILNAASLTSYTCTYGDRICIEIGIGRSAGTTARNGTISFGSSSSTDITTAGSTTANNPNIVFSNTLQFYQGSAIAAASTTYWDASTISYDSKNHNFTEEGSVFGFAISPDGTKVYTIGIGNNTVYQYTLSTPYDISTASYDSKSFNVSTQATTVISVVLKPDGTKMYVISNGGSIYQYSLSTPFDVSTASYDSKSLDLSSHVGNGCQFYISTDGSHLVTTDRGNIKLFSYSIGTAWDISTGSYVSSFDLSAQCHEPRAMYMSSDGKMVYVGDFGADAGAYPNAVYQYSLSSAWDVSSCTYTTNNKDISSQIADSFRGIFMLDTGSGSKFYANYNYTIYQYTISKD